MFKFTDNNEPKIAEFWEKLKIADCVLVISPEPADIDSLCSCLLLHEYLSHRDLGIPCPHILLCPQIPSPNENSFLKFLGPDLALFTSRLSIYPLPQCIVFVDYGSLSNCGLRPKDFSKYKYFIGLDHHSEPAEDFPENSLQLINPEAPSTTALIYELFCHKCFPINKKMATYVALGIMADTGRLTNLKTNADALNIVASCIRKGIPWEEIQEAAIPQMTLQRLDVWNKAKEGLNFFTDKVICLVVYRRTLAEWAGTRKDIETFFGTIMCALEKVDLAILIFEQADGTWKISFRSRNPKIVSAAEFAKIFNGGGHHHAATAIYNGAPFDAERIILSHLQKGK